MKPLEYHFRLLSYVRENWMGFTLFGTGFFVLLAGYRHLYGMTTSHIVEDLYANFGAEFLSIAITVLIVDSLAKRREEKELRDQLIQDMEGQSNQFSLRALAMLKSKRWFDEKLILDLDLRFSNLGGADLANIKVPKKDLTGIILKRSNLEKADLRNSVLSQADLTGVNLRGVNLTGATLNLAKLDEVFLEYASAQYTDLRKATISNATFRSTDLSHSDFSEADLSYISINDCDLSDSIFGSSNLQGAVFLDSNLQLSRFNNSSLEGADLSTANLDGASFSYARYDSDTRWPRQFSPEESGAIRV